MASTPTYASTPRCGSAQLAVGDTTVAKAVSNFAPAAAGTRLSEWRVNSGPTTAPGGTYVVALIVNDGTNDRVIDQFTLSNAANTLQYVGRFDNLILPTGYSLKVVVRTTLASGATLDVILEGADLT